MVSLESKQILPRPDRLHAIVEDFLSLWDGANSHILPLRRFLDSILVTDTRNFNAEECLEIYLTYQTIPIQCQTNLAGKGLLQAEYH